MINLEGVDTDSWEILPAGNYKVRCTAAEVKLTKDRMGEYVNLTLTVTAGTHEGRKVFTNFNVVNKSEKAVQIGKSQLKGYLKVVGFKNLDELKDVNELVGTESIATILLKFSDTWGEQNEVKSFRSLADQAEGFAQTDVPF